MCRIAADAYNRKNLLQGVAFAKPLVFDMTVAHEEKKKKRKKNLRVNLDEDF